MTPLNRATARIAAHVMAGSTLEVRGGRPTLVVPVRPDLVEAMREMQQEMPADARLPLPIPLAKPAG